MKRYDIINRLAIIINAKSYLEIGVQDKKNCFDKIKIAQKIGVDPDKNSNANFTMTSDEYFKNHCNRNFDIIFIDGLHHSQQVLLDIENSINRLSSNGFIVFHDCNPTEEIMQEVPRNTKVWTGDVWKAFVEIRTKRKDLCMYVIDTDFGVGIIKRGFNDVLKIETQITYNEFDKNRKQWLNLISVDEFLKMKKGCNC